MLQFLNYFCSISLNSLIIFTGLHCTHSSVFMSLCTEESGHSTPDVFSLVLSPPDLLAVLSVHPRMLLAFSAAEALCWLMIILSTSLLRTFSEKFLPRQSAPRVHQCMGCFSPRLGFCISFCCISLCSCWPSSPDCQGPPGALSFRTFSRFNNIVLLNNKKWQWHGVDESLCRACWAALFWSTPCWSIHRHNSVFAACFLLLRCLCSFYLIL